MAKEHWLSVIGYEEYYEVSDWGRVRRLTNGVGIPDPNRKPTMMKLRYCPQRGQIRYLGVRLSINGVRKSFNVHSLVLTTFVGPRPKGKEAAHTDGNTRNARLSNLRWATPIENARDKMRHGTVAKGSKCGRSKLSEVDVLAIKRRLGRGDVGCRIASDYGVCPETVYLIKNGTNWKHLNGN